jgi:hypothetical protein
MKLVHHFKVRKRKKRLGSIVAQPKSPVVVVEPAKKRIKINTKKQTKISKETSYEMVERIAQIEHALSAHKKITFK